MLSRVMMNAEPAQLSSELELFVVILGSDLPAPLKKGGRVRVGVVA